MWHLLLLYWGSFVLFLAIGCFYHESMLNFYHMLFLHQLRWSCFFSPLHSVNLNTVISWYPRGICSRTRPLSPGGYQSAQIPYTIKQLRTMHTVGISIYGFPAADWKYWYLSVIGWICGGETHGYGRLTVYSWPFPFFSGGLMNA